MFLSVIVCTRNRSEEIAECLPGLAEQAKLFSDVEIIIVDNGSTDNTKEIVEQLSASLEYKFRYIYEPIAGLCQARNRGGNDASGNILAYIDDDERIGQNWISQICAFFRNNTFDSLGGKIEVNIEGKPPLHISNEMMWFFGQSSLGEKAKVLTYPQYPQGGNFAVKKSAFQAIGGFDTNLKLYGDETEFFKRFSEQGFSMYYDPKVLVCQSIPANRLKKNELRVKSYKWGEGSATRWMLSNGASFKRVREVTSYTIRTIYMGVKSALYNDFGCFYTYWYNRGYLKQLIKGLDAKK